MVLWIYMSSRSLFQSYTPLPYNLEILRVISDYVNPYKPTQIPEEDQVAIWNHQADTPLYVSIGKNVVVQYRECPYSD